MILQKSSLKQFSPYQVFAVVSVFVIFVSTVTFLTGLFIDDSKIIKNKLILEEMDLYGNSTMDFNDKKDQEEEEEDNLVTALGVVDNLALSFFTLEYLLR